MTGRREARAIMEAVALLHRRGFGRLKLHCYVKEGLGAWRHTLFAAETFPASLRDAAFSASGSLPGDPVAEGRTAEEIASAIGTALPRLLMAARGADAVYVPWYRDVLEAFPGAILEMEGPDRAMMGQIAVPTPYGQR